MSNMSSIEDLLGDVQSELISVSLEYAGGSASEIFVYASMENGTIFFDPFFDPFFVVNGAVVTRGSVPGADTSIQRQKALVNYGTAQLQRLFDCYTERGLVSPTQLKLHYAVEQGALDSDLAYTPQYSDSASLHNIDLSKEWQAEIAAQRARSTGA